MTDTFEELRIIAKDYRGFDKHDRELLEHAADELESVYRRLIATQDALIESNGKRIALNDRLLEIKRAEHSVTPWPPKPPYGEFKWHYQVKPCR